MIQKMIAFFLFVVAVSFPIEHKYDRLFSKFSRSLIQKNLDLPSWFDYKIFFYASDLLLLVAAFFSMRALLRNKFATPLHVAIGWIVLSLLLSPLGHYIIPYLRVAHLLTALIFFSLLVEYGSQLIRPIFYGVIVMALFQSFVAIGQYIVQAPLGLRIFSEPKVFASIATPDGMRWCFDRIANESFALIIRPSGTFPHANVLGGYLCMSVLLTLHLFSKRLQGAWAAALCIQIFALFLTYSRSALFALLIGALLFFALYIKQRYPWRQGAFTLIISILGSTFVLLTPLTHRGGVVGSAPLAQASNQFRITHQQIAYNMIEKNPFFGVGYGRYPIEAPSFLPLETELPAGNSATHNIYLLLASEAGLPALFAFLTFIALILYRAFVAIQSHTTIALLSIFIAFLFIGGCDFYLLLFQQGRLMFFLIAGLLAAQRGSRQISLISLSIAP